MTKLTPLGGPTALIDVEGVRFLVDPTFDPPQDYAVGTRTLTKLSAGAWGPAQVGDVDAVLLSHDQHPDNLDHGGREFVARAALTLTTPLAASRLAGTAVGLEPWQRHDVGGVTVTAVPAQHGPDGTEHLTGPVTGFVLEARGRSLYVSGDNASLRIVEEIARCFPAVDAAVLFAGAARTAILDDYLTFTSAAAVEAATILGRPRILAVQTDGWSHWTQDGASLRDAFAQAGLSALLLQAEPGVAVTV
jgi:L-ascorbate metabolism protein UlaG (beta-lactamase superfamily)